MNTVTEFYNKFSRRLLLDYACGNKRLESAIRFAKSTVSVSRHTLVLDIGCGLGWSSNEIADLPHVEKVHGIDLSPENTKKASLLFGRPSIQFETVDVTHEAALPGVFNSIVLLDVYEHIPCDAREEFDLALNRLLAEEGIIILTCPSVFNITYLREFRPDEVQPVDEDIDMSVLQRLADRVGGEVVYFSYKTIWSPNDYFHALIGRGFSREKNSLRVPNVEEIHSMQLEPQNRRLDRLKESGLYETISEDLRRRSTKSGHITLARNVLNRLRGGRK